MIRTLNPGVLTLDSEMSQMDGLEFREKLMRLQLRLVVMVSTLMEQGSEPILRVEELGAVDFVARLKMGIRRGLEAYFNKIAGKIWMPEQPE